MEEQDIRWLEPAASEPFARVPIWLLGRVSHRALMVFVGLASYVDRRNVAWPGQQGLAERLGMSVKTLQRGLEELREAGAIEVKRRGLQQTNLYLLRMSSPEASDLTVLEASELTYKPESGNQREEPSSAPAGHDALSELPLALELPTSETTEDSRVSSHASAHTREGSQDSGPWAEITNEGVLAATGGELVLHEGNGTPGAPPPPSQSISLASSFCIALLGYLRAMDFKPRPAEVTRAWVRDAELMFRLDRRDPDEVAKVLDWLSFDPGANAAFWRPNIRSPAKFREKYDSLVAQMRRPRVNPESDWTERMRDRQEGLRRIEEQQNEADRGR